ncbi:MAG: carboxypeptidase regulatory-like domain-containing protein, partial [Thermoguttaceae bacterium]
NNSEVPVLTFSEILPSQNAKQAATSTYEGPAIQVVEEDGKIKFLYENVLYGTKNFSGKVVDKSGNPIAGAVGIIASGYYPWPGKQYTVTTNENGTWEVGPFFDFQFVNNFTFTHPDFVKYNGNISLDFSLVEMDSGNSISGNITDQDGKPLENVEVLVVCSAVQVETSAKTDENGNYFVKALPPGNYSVIPQSHEKAFCGRMVDVDKKDKIADFVLHPARTIKISFVTEDGKPFHDAYVEPYEWKEYSSINSNIFGHMRGWEMEDNGATWKWVNAPCDEEIRFRTGWHYYPALVHFFDDKHVYTPETGGFILTPEVSEYVVKMVASDPLPLQSWETDRHIYLPEKLDLTLVDQNGEPVVGADINAVIGLVNLDSKEFFNEYISTGKKYSGKIQTDSQGKCVLDFSSFKRNQIILFSMDITAGDDFLSAQVNWRETFGHEGKKMRIDNPTNCVPEQWTMTLPRYDRSISGTLVNEEGKGIPDINISLFAPHELRYYGTLTPHEIGQVHFTKTNSEGKWSIPKFYNSKESTHIKYSSPDYIEASDYIQQVGDNEKIPPRVMKKAALVTVRVKDEKGTPVIGAKIFRDSAVGVTNYDRKCPIGDHVVVVDRSAQSSVEIAVIDYRFTPEKFVHEVKSDNDLVEVTLKQGKTLRVRAVDTAGDPVSGVSIEKITWPDYYNKQLGWFYRLYFDYEGVLNWKNAPDVEAEYKFDCGYNHKTEEESYLMRPGDTEYTITVIPKI